MASLCLFWLMSEDMHLRHLAEADRHIAEARLRIDDQRKRIARRIVEGHATAISRELLGHMEEALRLTIAHRALIIEEIG